MNTINTDINASNTNAHTPKIIDTFQIPFPKTLAELAALDATREIPYLKALCNRRHIYVPGPNPTPAQIIPIIEQRLRDHERSCPDPRFPINDLAIEWKAIHTDLYEFLTELQQLAPPPSIKSIPSISSAPSVKNLPPPSQSGSSASAYSASSAVKNHPDPLKTAGHFNKSNQTPPKTPAISTNASATPKNLGHSNNPPPENFSTSNPAESPTDSQTHLPSPSVPSVSSVVKKNSAPSPKRRNDPILDRLTPDQKQQLIILYEQHAATEASRLAAEKLNIQISSGTLSRLYTTHRLDEDIDTINDLAAAHPQSQIASLTENQLQLRLLELASRPNMDHSELRAICHSFARLQSLKLSARRVQLAESKEARLVQQNETLRDFSLEETTEGIRAMMGKPPEEDHHDSADLEHQHDHHNNNNNDNDNRSNRREEVPINSAPHATPSLLTDPHTPENLPVNQNENNLHPQLTLEPERR
jgi:hypothetical protein